MSKGTWAGAAQNNWLLNPTLSGIAIRSAQVEVGITNGVSTVKADDFAFTAE